MIEKLTKRQEKQMIEVRDHWVNKVYNCEPTNEASATELIGFMYKLSGLKEPRVIFADSPTSAQVLANVVSGNSVGDSVEASVWHSVWDSVQDSVGASVGTSVQASVWDSVRDSVRASVWHSVGTSVRDSVGASVGTSVRASVSITKFNQLWYGEAWAQGWQAFHDFFVRKTGIVEHGLFENYINLVDKSNAYYILAFEKVCIVTRAPKKIDRRWHNNRWVMHNDEGEMAIEWGDGTGQYVLHGVTVEKDDYFKIIKGESNFEDVMSIENIELRMLYLKYLDPIALLKGAKAKLIDTGTKPTLHFDYSKDKEISSKVTYNDLYIVENLFDTISYFLKYEDPSTGRIYLSGVDPVIGAKGDADLCMAWKHNLTLDEYQKLEIQS